MLHNSSISFDFHSHSIMQYILMVLHFEHTNHNRLISNDIIHSGKLT
jgi:hypothetical protein